MYVWFVVIFGSKYQAVLIANQVVQRCKLPYVVLVDALYGLGQLLISLACTMNIIIPIQPSGTKGFWN